MTLVLPTDFERLFVARTHSHPIEIAAADAPTGSRMGGARPELLGVVACPQCARPLAYWATLESDVLSMRGPEPEALSILFCPDFDCRYDAHYPIDPSPVVVVTHPSSPRRSSNDVDPAAFEGRSLVLGGLRADAQPRSERSKLGGRPGYIQGEEIGEEFDANGYEFLLQLDDMSRVPGYPAPFSHGTLYLFQDREAPSKLRAFYQSS